MNIKTQFVLIYTYSNFQHRTNSIDYLKNTGVKDFLYTNKNQNYISKAKNYHHKLHKGLSLNMYFMYIP